MGILSRSVNGKPIPTTERQLRALEEVQLDVRLTQLIAREFSRLVDKHPGWTKWKAMRKAGEKYNVKFNAVDNK